MYKRQENIPYRIVGGLKFYERKEIKDIIAYLRLIQNGDGSNKNIAFVQVDSLPEYKLCLLKRNIVPNDEEIYLSLIHI